MYKAQMNICIFADHNRIEELVEWLMENSDILKEHNLFSIEEIKKTIERFVDNEITIIDWSDCEWIQGIMTKVKNNELDLLILFYDEFEEDGYIDYKVLVRLCVLWEIPVVSNQASASLTMKLLTEKKIDEYYENCDLKKTSK